MRWTLLLALLVWTAVLLNAQTSTGSGGDRKFTIDECVNQFSIARIESTAAGYQYWFADKKFLDGRTLKMSVVGAHAATHAPHSHPEDEFFFILEGKAEVSLNGATRVIEPYSSFYCPPNSTHGIRNPGDKILKYLVIKKYDQQ